MTLTRDDDLSTEHGESRPDELAEIKKARSMR